MITSVIFDFGGVIAEEGFREGLRALGAGNGLDPERFFTVARELIYETGYITGHAPERAYWDAVRQATGIRGTDRDFREEIISRFVLRPDMLDEADRLWAHGLEVGILSDQTNWLDEIENATRFSRHFDHVLNSYHLGKSKRDPSLFHDVTARLHRKPKEIQFIDDDENNVKTAVAQGWNAVHFRDVESFKRELARMLPRPDMAR
jgi:putative hydrolase of the HAD superfamily